MIEIKRIKGIQNKIYLWFNKNKVDIVEYHKNSYDSHYDFITYEIGIEINR